MVFKKDENLKSIHKKTMDLHEKQLNNAQQTSKHHQLEQSLHEMNIKEKNTMNRLFESWKKDRDFLVQLNQISMDLNDNKRFIRKEVSNQYKKLLEERKKLERLEDELMDRKVVEKGGMIT